MSDELRDSYDRVAREYTQRLAGELAHKPFDRKMLDWLIERVGELGPICDMGCGPGHIAGYLHEQGAQVSGIDISPEMLRYARQHNPTITFYESDMLDLAAIPDQSYGGIAAFYSIIHIDRSNHDRLFHEFRRILVHGGTLLVSFHLGNEVRHFSEWWGEHVSLDFRFFEREEVKLALQAVGFQPEEAIERDPYPEVEVQTRRAYLFARAP